MVKDGMRRCSRCRRTKAVGEFYRNRSGTDGLDAYCKPCRDGINREWQARRIRRAVEAALAKAAA